MALPRRTVRHRAISIVTQVLATAVTSVSLGLPRTAVTGTSIGLRIAAASDEHKARVESALVIVTPIVTPIVTRGPKILRRLLYESEDIGYQ